MNNSIAAHYARVATHTAALEYMRTPDFEALLAYIYKGVRIKSGCGEGVGVFDFTRICKRTHRSPQLVANALRMALTPLGFKLDFPAISHFRGLMARYRVVLFWGTVDEGVDVQS